MAKKKIEKSFEQMLKEALVKADEQPYAVPGNWVWVRLEDLFDITSSKRVFKSEWKKSGIPFYRAREIAELSFKDKIDNDLFISKEMYENYSKKYGMLAAGDILITAVGTLGKVYIVQGNDKFYFKDGNVIWLKKKNALLKSSIIKFFFESSFMLKMIQDISTGTVVKTYTITKAKKTLFPLPPLEEQNRIVQKLSSMLGNLNEARELILEAKETFEERRAAILNKAFTGELTKKWRYENPDVESAEDLANILIAENKKQQKEGKKGKILAFEKMFINVDEYPAKLPTNWVFVRLGEVVQINPPKYKPDIIDDTLCSFVPMKAVSDILGTIENIETEPFGKVKNGYTSFKENDVLYAKITPCMENGKAAIAQNLINGFGFGSTEFFVFRCSSVVINKYLYHLVRSKSFRNMAEPNMTGTVGQKRVPKNYLHNYKFPLPPLSEQKEIVRVLDNLLGHEDEAKALIDMEEQVDLLEKSILSKAFRGELGTNDPNDEPAMELLKKSLREKMNV